MPMCPSPSARKSYSKKSNNCSAKDEIQRFARMIQLIQTSLVSSDPWAFGHIHAIESAGVQAGGAGAAPTPKSKSCHPESMVQTEIMHGDRRRGPTGALRGAQCARSQQPPGPKPCAVANEGKPERDCRSRETTNSPPRWRYGRTIFREDR